MLRQSKIETITCQANQAKSVFVAGDFNNWSSHAMPLSKGRGGVWKLKLGLPPGRYEYKFIVDGEWCCDPGCPGCVQEHAECKHCIVNQYGSMNRVLIIK